MPQLEELRTWFCGGFRKKLKSVPSEHSLIKTSPLFSGHRIRESWRSSETTNFSFSHLRLSSASKKINLFLKMNYYRWISWLLFPTYKKYSGYLIIWTFSLFAMKATQFQIPTQPAKYTSTTRKLSKRRNGRLSDSTSKRQKLTYPKATTGYLCPTKSFKRKIITRLPFKL